MTLTKIEPGTPIIYERVDNMIYGRFRDHPNIPRWVVEQQPNEMIDVITLRKINDLAREDTGFKHHLELVLKEYGITK